MDALQAKVSALYGHYREPSKNVMEFRSGDMSSFSMLHTASSAYAQLARYSHHTARHPECLYEQLLVGRRPDDLFNKLTAGRLGRP